MTLPHTHTHTQDELQAGKRRRCFAESSIWQSYLGLRRSSMKPVSEYCVVPGKISHRRWPGPSHYLNHLPEECLTPISHPHLTHPHLRRCSAVLDEIWQLFAVVRSKNKPVIYWPNVFFRISKYGWPLTRKKKFQKILPM